MATLVVAFTGAALGAGTTGLTAGLIAAATAAAAIGAAYIDQKYVYPKLFPQDEPRQPNVTGIDTMTGQDGSPGHRSWGRSALVGGHALFLENPQADVTTTTSKKGPAGPSFTKKTADLGIGWTKNLITHVQQINADQQVLWRRDPNNVLWSDYRATVTLLTSPDRISIVPTVGDAQDFGPIFAIGDVVRTSNAITMPNGFYRVYNVGGHGGSPAFGFLELTPLEGQTPVSGTAGTSAAPMEILRMDGAIADYLETIRTDPAPAAGAPIVKVFLTVATNGPNGSADSHYWRQPSQVFTPGSVVRFENWNDSIYDGLYRVIFNAQNGPEISLVFETIDGRTFPTSATTLVHPSVTDLGRILLVEEGFLDPTMSSSLTPITHYLGTPDQAADSDLAAIYGASNVHGYRGLARTTLRKFNLSNFGDRVPQLSGVVHVAPNHTTHNVIRDVMREAFRGDDSRYDLTRLAANVLLGYTRRGQQSSTSTLQPLAIAYGIEAQEQGEKFVFFKGVDADLHQLSESDLGAYVGRLTKPPQKFAHTRIQDRDLPRRLSLYYRDPLNDYTRSEKLVRTSQPDDAQNEEVAIDVDPLVFYPWDAQNAVNRLFAQSVVGRDQGTISVPPSRMDILPNDRTTFTALNWNEEDVTLVAGAIAHTTQIAEVEPYSISIEVVFESAGGCRLVDNGASALVGVPPSVTVSSNSVTYSTGVIVFDSDDPIVEARIRYEFPNPWRMRVQRVTRHRNRVTDLALVAVAEKFPVLGSPVQINEPTYSIVVRPANLATAVLDIPAVFPSHAEHAGIHYVAAAKAGSVWRGAGVYSSEDDVAYILRGTIHTQTPIGVTLDALPDANPNVVDWVNELNVQLDYGTLSDRSLSEIETGIGFGWYLVGDEILAAQEATLNVDGTYTLRGLIRGLRDTTGAMGTHAIGERFVALELLGVEGVGGGLFEEFAMPGAVGQTLYIKIVPVGAFLDDIDSTQVTFTAANVRPFAPSGLIQGDFRSHGYTWNVLNSTYDPSVWLNDDITIRWFRRSHVVLPGFGAGSSAPLVFPIERYLVEVIRNGTVLTHRTQIVGTINSGSSYVHRIFRYPLASQLADGFASTDTAAIRVRQIGVGGSSGLGNPSELAWVVP